MLKKVLLVVSLGVLLATMAVASTGCASSSGLSAMLARVPSDAVSVRYVNARALRNDTDLEDLYDVWKTSVDSSWNRTVSTMLMWASFSLALVTANASRCSPASSTWTW